MSYPLSQTVGYATLALGCLAQLCPGRRQARDIAGCTGVPLAYLRKVLNSLAAADLVDARRGHKGGFALLADPAATSLWDVVVAVEGPQDEQRCLLGLTRCTDEHACPMHDFWKTERDRIEQSLRDVTLEQAAAHAWSPDVLGQLLPRDQMVPLPVAVARDARQNDTDETPESESSPADTGRRDDSGSSERSRR